MTRYFSAILLLLMVVTGCKKSSDYSLENPYGSKLEVTSDYKKSSFTLPLKSSSSEVVIDKIKVELVSLSSGKVINVEAGVQFKLGALICSLRLQHDSTIPDSDYQLRLIHEHPDIPKHNFVVSFRDEMMCGLLSDPDKNYYAGLKLGKGTAESPYLIRTSDDFKTFMYGLFNDVSRGRGLYFKQTVDIDAPATSNSSDGVGYRGEDFAGNYDGGGFTFSFEYTGDIHYSKYYHAGMFATLNSGAKISNLKIDYGINGVGCYAGALAGRGEGSIEIHNVKIEGNITNVNEYAGGLIGAVVGSQGDVLRIENVEFKGSIIAEDYGSYLGGLIGAVEGVAVDIKNANSKLYQPVKGVSCVGGLIGSFIGETITISQCELKHSVSQEDGGIVILNASDYACGGVIGYAKVSQSLNMESVIVDMSVGNFKYPTGSKIGGLLGAMDVMGGKYVNFKNCMVNGMVSGGSYVGGYVGHTYSTDININFIGRANYMSANVTGSGNFVGGMFGYADYIIVEPVSEINISTLVKGVERCGGFAGSLYGATITMNDKFKISSLTNVVGDNSVGGFVGQAGSSDFKGTTDVTYNSQTIPSKSSFNKVVYSGKVNSAENNMSNSDDAGGFIGYGEKVNIEGIVVSASVYGRNCIGGIAGRLSDSKIKNCVSSGEHVQSAGSKTGGVVGYLSSGEMTDVINYTKIKSSKGSVGGVVGAVSSTATLSTVVNMGLIDGSGSVGGVVGSKAKDNKSFKIKSSANYGVIRGNNLENGSMGIGGIIGWVGDKITIEGCANHSSVSSSGNHYKGIGGIAGVLGTDYEPFHPSDHNNYTTVSDCINTGALTGITNASEYIGGIVGYIEEGISSQQMSMQVENCLNTGNVETDSKSNNGGIVGCTSDYDQVYRCLNTGIVRYGNGVIGTHNGAAFDKSAYLYSVKGGGSNENKDYRLTAYITASNKSYPETYKGFDFKTKWEIGYHNNGFAYLRNCYFQFIYKGE